MQQALAIARANLRQAQRLPRSPAPFRQAPDGPLGDEEWEDYNGKAGRPPSPTFTKVCLAGTIASPKLVGRFFSWLTGARG